MTIGDLKLYQRHQAAAAARLRAATDLRAAGGAALSAIDGRLDAARHDFLYWSEVIAEVRSPPAEMPPLPAGES